MTDAGNERIRLFANALNAAATSCFTVGIATPLAGYIYDVSGFRAAVNPSALVGGFAGWLFTAVCLHLLARRVLGGLTS